MSTAGAARPPRASALLGVSGAVRMLGWMLWAARAVPRMARTKTVEAS